MHEQFLTCLQSVTKVRLVSLLRDERLGWPNSNDMRVFFPDMHLVTNQRRDAAGYSYLPNEDLLLNTLEVVEQFKRSLVGKRLIVYHLGDLLDLWREKPVFNPTMETATLIERDHTGPLSLLYGSGLDVRFLFGNHDFDLYRWKNYDEWQRSFELIGQTGGSPTIAVLHGDIFDLVEKLPDALQQFFVYYVSPFLKPSSNVLKRNSSAVKQHLDEQTHQDPGAIQSTSPSQLGALQDIDSIPVVGSRWNISLNGHEFMNCARRFRRAAREAYNADLRVVVIGHTHYARIAVDDGDDFLALVDCGAWVDDYTSAGNPTPQRNSQVGVLCGNEVRIYQLG